MKIRWIILNAALLVLSLGIVSAQDVQVPAEKPEHARHATGVALLRTINTCEIEDKYTYGSFSSWQILLVHNQKHFDEFAIRLQIPDAKLAEPPEVTPGWNLRLNVHPDGQGYDVMLQDTTDKKYGYALFTNEIAVIWESKPI